LDHKESPLTAGGKGCDPTQIPSSEIHFPYPEVPTELERLGGKISKKDLIDETVKSKDGKLFFKRGTGSYLDVFRIPQKWGGLEKRCEERGGERHRRRSQAVFDPYIVLYKKKPVER